MRNFCSGGLKMRGVVFPLPLILGFWESWAAYKLQQVFLSKSYGARIELLGRFWVMGYIVQVARFPSQVFEIRCSPSVSFALAFAQG